MIKSDDCVLGAKHLKIEFNEKNMIKTVYGEGEISFKKEKISGSSERVNWLFEKDMIIFRGSSQIKKTSGGVTEGKELRFDLKNDKITVISDEDKRSKTIIE